LILIFNSKAKILIKTITLNKAKKKKKDSREHVFFPKQMESPIGIGNKRVRKSARIKPKKII
jgi:hypothetical protein